MSTTTTNSGTKRKLDDDITQDDDIYDDDAQQAKKQKHAHTPMQLQPTQTPKLSVFVKTMAGKCVTVQLMSQELLTVKYLEQMAKAQLQFDIAQQTYLLYKNKIVNQKDQNLLEMGIRNNDIFVIIPWVFQPTNNPNTSGTNVSPNIVVASK